MAQIKHTFKELYQKTGLIILECDESLVAWNKQLIALCLNMWDIVAEIMYKQKRNR